MSETPMTPEPLLSVRTRELVEMEADRNRWKARVAELEQREVIVAHFVAQRAEYVTALRNCHPDNGHDYNRWQGHAAARRQLAKLLGLPVAWPAETDGAAPTQSLALKPGACTECGMAPEQWCPDCAACERGCHGGFDGNPCAHLNASWAQESGGAE
ncbi:hypothetical protein ACGFZR_15525 [Streptomyces sp. NPDC048241]|uniref:hypothetical protein n=1 Tax=Streptomyces sp. NPDC048241 TaxID=3365521 RepID=UPI003720850E